MRMSSVSDCLHPRMIGVADQRPTACTRVAIDAEDIMLMQLQWQRDAAPEIPGFGRDRTTILDVLIGERRCQCLAC